MKPTKCQHFQPPEKHKFQTQQNYLRCWTRKLPKLTQKEANFDNFQHLHSLTPVEGHKFPPYRKVSFQNLVLFTKSTFFQNHL